MAGFNRNVTETDREVGTVVGHEEAGAELIGTEETEMTEDLLVRSGRGGGTTVNLSPDDGRVPREEFGVRGNSPNHVVATGEAEGLALIGGKIDS